VQLVDTYDSLEGTKKAAGLGQPLWGIRLDSGDFPRLSRAARAILDEAGLQDAKIMLSGDLDEYRIRELVREGAPVDAFGVGTQLATSADAPSMGTIYKLVELDISGIKRFTAKMSEEKSTLPGAKQIFRFEDHDVLGRSGECSRGKALLRPVLLGGQLVEPLANLDAARARAAESIGKLPAAMRALELAEPWPVRHSQDLAALIERTRRNLPCGPCS
jgi:nicotinate phosphoribosyltransferase